MLIEFSRFIFQFFCKTHCFGTRINDHGPLTSSILKPPLNDHLAFGKKPDGIPSLSMQDTIKRVLHPTEWKEGHWCHDPDINSNVTTLNIILELSRGLSI